MRGELLAHTEGQSSPPSCIYVLHIVVYNHWTGLVDCTGAGTGGLDRCSLMRVHPQGCIWRQRQFPSQTLAVVGDVA